jgi:hypothetical protein
MSSSNDSQNELVERGIDMDVIHDFVECVIPSPSISSQDEQSEIEQKQKATRRKRQVLAFVIILVFIIAGIIINKI